jgi:hypothetical protein
MIRGVITMPENEGRTMTKRIPISPETHDRFREFSHGLGTTMDEAVNFLLDLVSDTGDAMRDGKSLRVKLAEMQLKKDNESGRKEE